MEQLVSLDSGCRGSVATEQVKSEQQLKVHGWTHSKFLSNTCLSSLLLDIEVPGDTGEDQKISETKPAGSSTPFGIG